MHHGCQIRPEGSRSGFLKYFALAESRRKEGSRLANVVRAWCELSLVGNGESERSVPLSMLSRASICPELSRASELLKPPYPSS